MRKADFNVGSHINTMFRVRCKVWDPATRKRYSEAMEKRHITYFGEAARGWVCVFWHPWCLCLGL